MVVVAAAANPVTTFELDGRAMWIVADFAVMEVVVTTCLAEPVTRFEVTRFELRSFSFAHELRLCAHTHRLSAHSHHVELEVRAIGIVAGFAEVEVVGTTCLA